ncbi:MAG: hypothetical protein ACRCYY_13340 [Trueperaceae bacterium]
MPYLNSHPLAVLPQEHSMGDSLIPYLELKINRLIRDSRGNLEKINVVAEYDRIIGDISQEKTEKMLNYKRPSTTVIGDQAVIRCFPGRDYVFHFASIMASYIRFKGWHTVVNMQLPPLKICDQTFEKSFLDGVEKLSGTVAIVGKIEDIYGFDDNAGWQGAQDFLWKHFDIQGVKGILLGCRHTIWGDIAGRLVEQIANLGFETVIYVGKLGSLYSQDVPSQMLATGNSSFLPDGRKVEWENLFASVKHECLVDGVHVTLPSVLQESKVWLLEQSGRFVDPEIGHMAQIANQFRVRFSYLHVISDNVRNRSYRLDLSNERLKETVHHRKRLYQLSSKILYKAISIVRSK